MTNRLFSVLILSMLTWSCAEGGGTADLVLRGGTIWTGVEGASTADAVAIEDDRIVFVGSDPAVAARIGADTRVVELDGRLVTPGFMDDHTHFMNGGFQLASVDLRDADSPAEFARRLGRFAAGLEPGAWVTGGDWDHELWEGSPLPERDWIDSVTSRNPVFVSRLDGHMALANSLAMELAGIDGSTADPPGGTIIRDGSGRAAGVLKDEAMRLVSRHLPEPSETQQDAAFRRAQAHALSKGVTMVHDMGSWSDLETYRRARDRGELDLRIYGLVPLSSWERLRDHVAERGRGDERLMWGGLKGFVDGSLGSTTAWFYEPYEDEPGTSGLVVTDTAALADWIRRADAAGLQVVVHAIGDRANDWLLDTFEAAARENGERDRRFRIEHAQHLSPAAITRFAELGVLPSMQPYHAIDDGRWAENRIGPERIRTTYAFRSLLDADAGLMFGSDWTVAPMDPLLGIDAAVHRRTIDGANPTGWVPDQKVSVAEALRAYTSANAYGAFVEDRLGSIEPGKLADLVVLDARPADVEALDAGTAAVDMTMVGGEILYQRQ